MGRFSYEFKDFDLAARLGIFKVNDKEMITPNLFPVVSPFKNLITPEEMFDKFGVQAIFTNAYIIYKNKEKHPEIIEKGLHSYFNFPGIIATDSGGFQDYMYGGDLKISPDEIEEFQEIIGSDCPVILDIPVQTTDDYETAKNKVDITIERAKDNIKRRKRDDTAWFGPIHGSIYSDLVAKSAIEMSKLDFGIHPIGGVVKTFNDYRFELSISILLQAKKYLRPDRVVHMFGLGLPAFFSLAVACGADTFDSAAYILFAQDERYFTTQGTEHLKDLEEFPCNCPVCSKYTPKEIKSMDKEKRTELIARHNLYLSFSELKTIRQAIRQGTLWDLVEQRVSAHPNLLKAFNLLKKDSELFLEHINLSKTHGQFYLHPTSFFKPHFIRYRKRILRYKIPDWKHDIVILPELDLPGISGKSVINWLRELKNKTELDRIQIIIASNILGPIPIELSELYPAAQRSGNPDLEYDQELRTKLISVFSEFFKLQKMKSDIHILIPKDFLDEFNTLQAFEERKHIIYYLPEMLSRENNSIKIEVYDDITILSENIKTKAEIRT